MTQRNYFRENQINGLAHFLEFQANANTKGHDSNDGAACVGHREAFEALAVELLELIEDDYGYGETPEAKAELSAQKQLEEGVALELWIQRNSDNQLWAEKVWTEMTSGDWDPEALECLDEARELIKKESN